MIFPKIQYLQWLQTQKVQIPFFLIFGKDTSIKKIKNEFFRKNITSIIIRSAALPEDGNKKSFAGIFESSPEIFLKNLNNNLIDQLFLKNQKKNKDLKTKDVSLFIQEYIRSDFSGVLFTQAPCDENIVYIECSSHSHKITEGKLSEYSMFYNKKEKFWYGNADILSLSHKLQIQNLIEITEKKIHQGADIEFGIKDDILWVYQIRPITRNFNEEILLKESLRLRGKFQKDFSHQVWERNSFCHTLGDLTPFSIDFYNTLLASDELYDLLRMSYFIKERSAPLSYDILENIGGRLYMNTTQEQIYFPKQAGFLHFLSIIKIIFSEKIMRKKSKTDKNKITLEKSFAWFFLSGLYIQLFLHRDKGKFSSEDFVKRLKNTEFICNAMEPRPISSKREDIKRFQTEFFYMSDNLYELSSLRYKNIPIKTLCKKYQYLKKHSTNYSKQTLSENVCFWIKEKIFWKQQFLQHISSVKCPKFLNKEKISDVYIYLSGDPFFSSITKKVNEKIIVSGFIDFNNIKKLSDSDDIAKYLGQTIAVSVFPIKWIPYIQCLKGIVIKEGNMLSHMAITCREYSIPCRIIPHFF